MGMYLGRRTWNKTYKGRMRYYLGCMLLDIIQLLDVSMRVISLGIIHCDFHSYLLFNDELDDWMDK